MDRTKYWHDYYLKHRDRIVSRRKQRNKKAQEKNNLASKVWRAKNREALKIATGLGVKIAEARKILDGSPPRQI